MFINNKKPMRKHTKWSLIETKYLVIWIMWFFLIIYAIMKYQKLKRNLYTACVVANLFLIPSPVLWAEQSYAQSTRLSLELSNATISDVFASVEKNSEYRFFYSDAVRAELYRNVDVNIDNKSNLSKIVYIMIWNSVCWKFYSFNWGTNKKQNC